MSWTIPGMQLVPPLLHVTVVTIVLPAHREREQPMRWSLETCCTGGGVYDYRWAEQRALQSLRACGTCLASARVGDHDPPQEKAADTSNSSWRLSLSSLSLSSFVDKQHPLGHSCPSEQLHQEARLPFVLQQTHISYCHSPGTLCGNTQTDLKLQVCLMLEGLISVQGHYFKSPRRWEQSFDTEKDS